MDSCGPRAALFHTGDGVCACTCISFMQSKNISFAVNNVPLRSIIVHYAQSYFKERLTLKKIIIKKMKNYSKIKINQKQITVIFLFILICCAFLWFFKNIWQNVQKKSSSLQIASKLKPPTGFLISEICQLLTTGNSPRNPSICHQPLPAVSRRGLEVLDLSTVKKNDNPQSPMEQFFFKTPHFRVIFLENLQ